MPLCWSNLSYIANIRHIVRHLLHCQMNHIPYFYRKREIRVPNWEFLNPGTESVVVTTKGHSVYPHSVLVISETHERSTKISGTISFTNSYYIYFYTFRYQALGPVCMKCYRVLHFCFLMQGNVYYSPFTDKKPHSIQRNGFLMWSYYSVDKISGNYIVCVLQQHYAGELSNSGSA